jgi:predicted DNA-binding transcriptional regulator YafY
MNRIDRLVGIILYLNSKKIVLASELAAHFGKSQRTIYRDMQALYDAGLPIAAEPGEGYSVVKGDYLPPMTFTPGEASALLMGTEFVIKKADISLRKDAQSALLKIKSILKDDTKEFIDVIDKSIMVYNQNTIHKNVLSNIQNSIANNLLIHLKYYSLSKNEVTEREIEPMGLIHYGENWRIIAFCRLRKDFREFRINRINSIKFLETEFKRKKHFSLSEFVSKEFQIRNPFEIKIWFDKKAARIVKEKYSSGLINEEQVKDGFILTFMYSKDKIDDITNWILLFHKSAKIISPDKMKDLILTKIEEIKNIYS